MLSHPSVEASKYHAVEEADSLGVVVRQSHKGTVHRKPMQGLVQDNFPLLAVQ